MMQFKAFKPQAMNKIAQAMGYQGDMGQFQQYIEQDPARQQQMNMYTNAAQKMAQGGMVQKFAPGGTVPPIQGSVAPMYGPVGTYSLTGGPNPNAPAQTAPPQASAGATGGLTGTTNNPSGTQAPTPTITGPTINPTTGDPENIGEFSVKQVYTPGVPVGGTTIAAQTQQTAGQDITQGTGTLTGAVAVPTATAAASQAQQITPSQVNTMQAAQAAPAVDAAMTATQAAQANPADPRAQVTAAQQTASSVGNLSAAQGNASLINSPVQRQIQSGELISGVADAATAAQFTEQIQAAQTTPTQAAMVQGQLDGLMQQFVGGNTPAWAAGAIRNANAAINPSTRVFVSSAIKLNRAGLSCFKRVVASQV